MKRFFIGFAILIIAIALLASLFSQTRPAKNPQDPSVYVGVSFQGDTVAKAKLLIDRVKTYTNLFILGITPVSQNETTTNEVCDYAVSQGLNIIVNFGYYTENPASPAEAFRQWPWQHSWVQAAKQKYGSRFLGVYYDDEPAGVNLDFDWNGFFTNYSDILARPSNWSLHLIYQKVISSRATGIPPSNYDLEAEYFQSVLKSAFYHGSRGDEIPTITSDYALYWYDYSGGYDVMLAEFTYNQSVAQDIALVKGAARLQNKTWGTIATWKYDVPPYLDSGKNIYDQMVEAYQAGATYITIFDYPYLPGNDYGVMTDEHFEALQRFWNNIVVANIGKPREFGNPDVALVLPKNYGWGMRNSGDRIWGIWGPDDKSPQIWNITQRLLGEYGLRLDIVYDDPAFPLADRYNKVYYWNETIT